MGLRHKRHHGLCPVQHTSFTVGVSLYAAQLAASLKGKKKALAQAERSAMLFTHKGYSGPAVLDLSHHVIMALEHQAQPVPGQQIFGRVCTLRMHCTVPTANCLSAAMTINWLGQPLEHWQALLQQGGPASAQAVLRKAGMPQRLAEALCREAGCYDTLLSQLKKV